MRMRTKLGRGIKMGVSHHWRLGICLLLFYLSCCRAQRLTLDSVEADDVETPYRTPATLQCEASFVDLAPSLGSFNITIQKEEGNHSAAEKKIEVFVATLTILSALYTDSGVYLCNATYEDQYKSTSFSLSVTETLVFVEQPQDTTVPLNQTAEFTCITNLPSIKRWLKNSLPLQFPAGSSKFEETENTLKIHLVEFADMGSYTCVVQLAGEVIEESGYLTADEYVAPHVVGVPGIDIVDGDMTSPIICKVFGTPEPVYSWHKDNISVTTEISKNGPYVDSENRLILSNANARHSGLYTCTGTNNITGDFASKSYDVTITSGAIVLWTQWYFILLYLIVVVVILVVVAVVVWFIVRERWSILIRERKVVKEKVKKSKSESKKKVKAEGLEDLDMENFEK